MAYADFVTAMMALFIVLWLMSSSEQGQEGRGRLLQRSQGHRQPAGHHHERHRHDRRSRGSVDNLQKLKDKLEQEIKARKELEKLSKQIEITITPEGLRIELIEGKNGTFYQSGSPR